MVRALTDYRDKVLLAPMVRAGTLPLRLLSLEYGCDIVYGPEIIDRKIAQSTRVWNDKLQCVDFWKDKSLVFRTCEQETNQVVFQMGTSDSVNALKAAEKVWGDVAAIDVNMGCPKTFSVQAGMGSALLTKPDLVKDILTTLVRNVPTTVTAKIRLLPDPKDTLHLAKLIESCGVRALGVHCRLVPERPRDPAHWQDIIPIVDSLNIPVILNGDLYSQEDIARAKNETGCASVMCARGGMENPSMFRKEGKLPLTDVVKAYVKKAVDWHYVYQNTKWTVLQMIKMDKEINKSYDAQMQGTKSMRDICKVWDILDYYEKEQAKWGGVDPHLSWMSLPTVEETKKRKDSGGGESNPQKKVTSVAES